MNALVTRVRPAHRAHRRFPLDHSSSSSVAAWSGATANAGHESSQNPQIVPIQPASGHKEGKAAASAPPALAPPTTVPPADSERKRSSHKAHPRARSIEQDILDDKGEEHCEHSIHPAYASTYSSSLCPTCLTKKRIRAIRVTRHSHCANMRLLCVKTLLMERRANLKRQHELEQSWEEGIPIETRDRSEHDILRDPELGCTTKALEHLSSLYKNGELCSVETHAIELHRRRARIMEVTTKPMQPRDTSKPYSHSDDEGPGLELNDEQRAFAPAYALEHGDPPEYGPKWASPLPKRRKLDDSLHVTLDSHGYVHKEADVDLLFSPSEVLTADFLEDATSVPATSRLQEGSSYMESLPTKPLDVKDVKIGDGDTAKTGSWRSEPETGYERIDTSGYKKIVDRLNSYR